MALAAGAGPGVSLSDSDGVTSGFLVLVDPALPACKDSASLSGLHSVQIDFCHA